MNTLSAFQLLPPHIVDKIVDHVVGSSRVSYNNIYHPNDDFRVLQMPLLWVCHNFRDFVFKRFCKFYALNLHELQDKAVVTCQLWPKLLEKVDHARNHFAKELTISLSVWDIYSGESLKQLSSGLHVGCAFPSVRKLLFRLITDDGFRELHEIVLEVFNNGVLELCHFKSFKSSNGKFPPNTAANIAAFVRRIKEMAPMVNEVHVGDVIDRREQSQRQNAYCVDLVRQLYGAFDMTIISGADEPVFGSMDLELVCNLVRLDCWAYDNADIILSLVRQNARTLQTIEILVYIDTDFTSLFRNPDDGAYLEFPCLRELELISYEKLEASQLSTHKGAVPFPRLQNLTLLMVYPFGDDVLFRGNAATLEYVKVVPCTQLVEVVKRYKVLTSTSHPKIRCVSFDLLPESPYPSPMAFVSDNEYLRFALSIAPGASVREIPDLHWSSMDIPSALSMLGGLVSVKVLSLPDVRMSIWDVITLIKSLPLLSDLRTMNPTLGELPQGVKKKRLPDYVRSTYAPMGGVFWCWHISIYNADYKEMATCVLLLALVFPNFGYGNVRDGYREPFMEAMKKKINKRAFRQDAPRLRRLLFNGRQE
ncbi:hypothetical protein IW146_002335 [Coemansia sp. RSA 922]|nr:hypothetical protein H4S03_001249 [Coemansia sp. S3946]KAJ2052567.1 hypothetical protein H4S04_001263 [Coemansia sp. S16]KAJ2067678.1 hypothetical protein GGI08_001260 [Coemansia sp. S2]KAJ2115418.1 hypothetical protein IW146_002335 [Coemansia sp. RSA 922]KAJ2351264.1 hypothetical protein GGH92_001926 [Coemansia sp. RSA 2673]